MHTQNGMSLIELMVAMTLGLLVTGAIGTLFVQNQASYKQNDEISYIQDNGRYALKAMAKDLEMVDFWAGFDDPGLITPLDVTPVNNCTTGAVSAFTHSFVPTYALTYRRQLANAGTVFPCVTNDYTLSDFMMIKRVRGQQTTSGWQANQVYFRTDLAQSRYLYQYDPSAVVAPTSSETDWEYKLHLYYVDKNFDLIRQTLVPGATAPTMQRDVIANGIEYFHVVFGLDTDVVMDANVGIDRYSSNFSSAVQTDGAYSAIVYVLARSSRAVDGYTNNKSYTLGDICYPVAADCTQKLNDGLYRRVFSTTVVLRNSYITSRLAL